MPKEAVSDEANGQRRPRQGDFRTSSHSGPLEIELTRRNIPFVKFGGLKFLDAAHVKDLLALLRFSENPRDRVAGFRILRPARARREAPTGCASTPRRQA